MTLRNAKKIGVDWYENEKKPGGEIIFGAHNDQHITANRKAYAMWWIRASIQEYILRSWSLVKLGTTAAQKKLF